VKLFFTVIIAAFLGVSCINSRPSVPNNSTNLFENPTYNWPYLGWETNWPLRKTNYLNPNNSTNYIVINNVNN